MQDEDEGIEEEINEAHDNPLWLSTSQQALSDLFRAAELPAEPTPRSPTRINSSFEPTSRCVIPLSAI